jgi:predicted RNA-binding protein
MQTTPRMTKEQIKTAEEVLAKAIEKKRVALADKEFKKELEYVTQAMEKYNKEVDILKEKYKVFKKEIEKNKTLEVDEDDCKVKNLKIPKEIEDINNYECPIKVKNRTHSYFQNSIRDYGIFEPDMTKMTEEVDEFILNLKLGTALMSDLKGLLNKINKI